MSREDKRKKKDLESNDIDITSKDGWFLERVLARLLAAILRW